MNHATRLSAICVLSLGICCGRQAAAQCYTFEIDSGLYPALSSPTVLFDGGVATFNNQFRDIILPSGFDFEFFGVTHDTVRVSENGYLTFPPQSGVTSNNRDFPDPSGPNAVIAAWWDDLIVTGNGVDDTVAWQITGTPGSRVLSVDWKSMSYLTDSETNHNYVSFRISLYEGSGVIEVAYGPAGVSGTPADFTASIGLENHEGTAGLAPFAGNPGLDRSTFPAFGTILRYTPRATAYTMQIRQETYVANAATRFVIWQGDVNPVDDEWMDIPIGFDFICFGELHTTLRVSSNGYATMFGADGRAFLNSPLPTGGIGSNILLAPWWDDLAIRNSGTVDEVSYQLRGASGSRELTVEWRSVSRHEDDVANTSFCYFQLHLLEDGNRIEMHYDWAGTTGTPVDYSATMGIQDATGQLYQGPFADNGLLRLADFPVDVVVAYTPIPNLLCGDCDTDGDVDILDSLRAATHAAGLAQITDPDFASCNVAGFPGCAGQPGTEVNILDALAIAQSAAGLPVTLACLP